MKLFVYTRWLFAISFLWLLPLLGHAQSNTFIFKDPLSQHPLVCAISGFVGGIYLIGTPVAGLALTFSGFLFVKARGNPAALAAARTNFVHVFLGVSLFLGSWLLGVALVSTANSVIPGLIPPAASC